MLFKFRDLTTLEKPIGSKVVGLKRGGYRPISIEFTYSDLEQLLKYEHKEKYLVRLWTSLAPQKELNG